jgi:DNA-binding HxlR family transcriptional regulator
MQAVGFHSRDSRDSRAAGAASVIVRSSGGRAVERSAVYAIWLHRATRLGSIPGMGRKRFGDMRCGVAQALEALGDWWTLLIVRDAFFGARRFADFEASLGIAKNVLASRLRHLVRHGILERVDAGREGTRFEYVLTAKGEALLPVLTTLREWSDRWVFGPGEEPVIVRERRTGRRVPRLELRGADGRPLGRRDLRTERGPGADPQIQRLLGRPSKRGELRVR